MLCRFCLLFLIPVAAFLSFSQQPPTFRTGTTLVQFTTIVLDSKGNPVTDLKKEEFTVTEDDRPRALAVFRFDGGREAAQPRESLPAGTFSNRTDQSSSRPQSSYVAILFDTINTARSENLFVSSNQSDYQLSARESVLRYLKDLPPNTRLAAFRLGPQVDMIHNFSADIASVRSHIAAADLSPIGAEIDSKPLPRQNPMGDAATADANQVVRDWRSDATRGGLEALGNFLAGIPGRKSLVWITAGSPIRIRTNGWPKSYREAMQRTAQRLASQGVAIYPGDAKALMRALERPAARGSRATNNVTQGSVFETFDMFAEITGGRVAKYTNDTAKGVTDATLDQRGAYTLGFYAGAEPDGRWHRLRVRINRPGVQVLHQQGYVSPAPSERPLDWPTSDWMSAAELPLVASALHIDARAELAGRSLAVTLLVPADELYFSRGSQGSVAEIEIGIAEKSTSGATRVRHAPGTIRLSEKTSVVRYANVWEIQPETNEIRLIFRDRYTGRYGSLDLPIRDVPLRSQHR